jgi:hypothetical protein
MTQARANRLLRPRQPIAREGLADPLRRARERDQHSSGSDQVLVGAIAVQVVPLRPGPSTTLDVHQRSRRWAVTAE